MPLYLVKTLLIITVGFLVAVYFLWDTYSNSGAPTTTATPFATNIPSLTTQPTSSPTATKKPDPTATSAELYTVEFDLSAYTVNPNVPGNTIQITSSVQQVVEVNKTSDTSAQIQDGQTAVYILSGTGETGGIYSYIPEYTSIENMDLGTSIAKVETTYNQLVHKNKIQKGSDSRYYFYTTEFGDKTNCAIEKPTFFCGSQEIKAQGENLAIICVANSVDSSELCDQFVSNLNVDSQSI